ncbi:INGR1 protein, partial [Brachypteracias leptosomus]|nr:INGR1 protein [Brachypteracias leptosomus]
VFFQSKKDFYVDNCTMYKCSIDIPIPAGGSNYCVSAKGSLYDVMVGALSEESCIYVPLKQTLMIFFFSFFFFSPPSPFKVSVIRNLNTDGILESKSEAKYVSVISFMPGQSPLPENVEVTSLEVEQKEETVSPENSSEEASSVPLPEALAKAEEVSVQKSTEQVSSDDEQNCKVKENYFISNSSQMDICSNSSDQEVSTTEIQQKVVPSSCLKFSGYDKPHIPLEMLIDIGEEQPVNAYRPTD